MKIVFTGGGTGGHFYPIIAVANEVNAVAKEKKLLTPKFFYIGPEPYDPRALYESNIVFKKSPAGKVRRYFSLWNVVDIFKTILGIMKTVLQMFRIYPDVVFSKGGYASFPTVFAARVLRIPVIMHESDAVPGRVNLWTGKFAARIGVSYPQAVSYFPKEKVAFTGNPVRKNLYKVAREGAHEFLKLDKNIPTILILGGSTGAERINNIVLEALKDLVKKYQIIHQTGKKNIKEVKSRAKIVLEGSEYSNRYKAFGFLDLLAMRMAAGAADIVVSRAGASAIFEIALWRVPSIIIPITKSGGDHQRKNAFSYARNKATVVVEERNFTPHVLISEIERILGDPALVEKMKEGASIFAKPDAARKIAEGIVVTALKHEK